MSQIKRNRPLKPFKSAIWNGVKWEGKPPAKKQCKPIRKISNKKHRKDLVYSQRRKWFLAQPKNSQCPVARDGLVKNLNDQLVPHHRAATTVHHAWKRGRYYLEESTWIGLSFEGHCWVEDNKAESRVRGWLCDTAETRERWRKCHDGLPIV